MEKTINDKRLQRALFLLERFKQNGDYDRVDKVKKLLKKIHDNEFIAAFSGHFSAGKSTMINALIGERVLPSSPIPTSANLVKVHQATEDFAKVYYEKQPPLLFQSPYDFNTVKEYCKSGDVLEIEIGRTDSDMPNGVTVMDTPGVDSTDDAHRISTESALHLADIVFYVMDYNHVQSELNFTYTKSLLKHGVKLYLIINQIDKHNDAELSFADFKQSVYDSFNAWNVHPEGIFFTSLMAPQHEGNEFPAVKQLIDEALIHQEDWVKNTIDAAFHRLIEEHDHWLKEQKEIESYPHEQLLTQYNNDELADIFAKEEQLLIEKETLIQKARVWEKNFEQAREELLKNAYLMPFETRDLAESFLESIQPDFKVGLFFSKRKTEEERAKRLNLFSENVRKQVESQLEWHLRELAATKIGESGLFRSDLEAEAQLLKVQFDNDLFAHLVSKGARVTGDYVLHYCDEVASKLKRIAVQVSDHLKEQVTKAIARSNEAEIKEKEAQLLKTKKVADACRQLASIEKQYEEMLERIHLPTENEEHILEQVIAEWDQLENKVIVYSEEKMKKQAVETTNDLTVERIAEEKLEENSLSIDHTIKKLDQAISYLADERSFQRITEQLVQKSTTLKEKNYTIALFGAFSAGKSSFANAMLGEQVLPVSPNPTTAAINRICPPNKTNKHGTALVHMKDEQQMLEDIQQSLQLFGVSCDSLDHGYKQIPSVLEQDSHEGTEKVHVSFLAAFREGYAHYKDELGKSISTTIEQFQGFVANESQSCFVESIDLFYDCPFTRKGVTLVDTPGADSINARHTDVAFKYIKDSDAILFVTYYNHAFSKADREFLIQLGRVKDAFELDKMFFIVNAIDLASSQEEVEDVLQYVNEQLSEYGIRFPRIFGLSSKLAQAAETREKSKIDLFNTQFNHFLENELTQMAVESAEAEFERAVAMLDQMIASASEDEDEKERKKSKLTTTKEAIDLWFADAEPHVLGERLVQEAKELLHYVKQRVFFRYPDFFRESFNPATLQRNSRELLQKALQELLEATGYDFAQELRATSLRLEQFIKRMLKERFEQITKELQTMHEGLTLSLLEFEKFELLEFQPAFEKIDRQALEGTFKYFKNPKSFFENNERKLMEEALQQLLSPLADQYLEDALHLMESHYKTKLHEQFDYMIDNMKNDIEEQYRAWMLAFEDHDKLEDWLHIRKALTAKDPSL